MSNTELQKLIDKAYKLRIKRLEAQRDVDDMKADEEALKRQVEELLRAAKLEGAKGKVGQVNMKRSVVPSVVDEAALAKWGLKNVDLVSVTIKATTYRELLADGKKVPGVESFTREEISLTKAS